MATDLPYIVRVVLEGTFNAEPFVNVLHFLKRDLVPPTAAELAGLIGILDDAAADDDAWSNILQFMDAGTNINTITATTLDNETPIQVASSVNLNGLSVGADMPPMLSIVLQWRSAIATRRHRGRTYLCGLNAGMVNNANSDRISSTIQTDLQTAATQFVDAWVLNATWGFVVVSQANREANLPTPYTEIASASVNALLAVQLRRRERPV